MENDSQRFFQWADQEGQFPPNGLLAKLTQRKGRKIRSAEKSKEPLENDLDKLKTGDIVKVKWFESSHEGHKSIRRGKVTAPMEIQLKDPLEEAIINRMVERGCGEDHPLTIKTLESYRKSPGKFKERFQRNINRMTTRVLTPRVDEAQLKECEDKIAQAYARLLKVESVSVRIAENVYSPITERYLKTDPEQMIVFADEYP